MLGFKLVLVMNLVIQKCCVARPTIVRFCLHSVHCKNFSHQFGCMKELAEFFAAISLRCVCSLMASLVFLNFYIKFLFLVTSNIIKSLQHTFDFEKINSCMQLLG